MIPINPKTVDLIGKNLIEASAGTGKTFTLSFLVLRMVVEKTKAPGDDFKKYRELSEIVVVTFTKAATAELKERITLFLQIGQSYLSNTIELEDNEKEVFRKIADNSMITDYLDQFSSSSQHEILNRLDQAILSIDEAQVYTIHGFCQRLLTDFAFETGAEFGQDMIQDISILNIEIINDFWRKEIMSLPYKTYGAITSKGGYKSPEELLAVVNTSTSFPNIKIIGDEAQLPDIQLIDSKIELVVDTLKAEWERDKDD